MALVESDEVALMRLGWLQNFGSLARTCVTLLLSFLVCAVSHAGVEDELLRPQEAFVLTSTLEGDNLRLRYDIAPGYYLYRHRFRFQPNADGLELGEPAFPPGKKKNDEFFGPVETYRDRLEIVIPATFSATDAQPVDVVSQGCADIGICFPPFTHAITVEPPPHRQSTLASLGGGGEAGGATLGDILRMSGDGPTFLPPEEAFRLEAESSAEGVRLRWRIEPGHYLYKGKMSVELLEPAGVPREFRLPAGESHEDEYFGLTEIYRDSVEALVVLPLLTSEAERVRLTVVYQGCADAGLCYPPQTEEIVLAAAADWTAALGPDTRAGPGSGVLAASPDAGTTPSQTGGSVGSGEAVAVVTTNVPRDATRVAAVSSGASGGTGNSPMNSTGNAGSGERISEQDFIARTLSGGATGVIIATFFGFGLLLAFTPCVLPMIPILSSIVVGDGPKSTRRAFALSLVYVLAMAVTYSAVGVLAGLSGANLQVAFQNPWILGAFSALFVALALSMFGFYELQIPTSWQTRLSEMSQRQRGGTWAGVGLMGVLSALIVGPCVAAPLAGALIYISQSGDGVLGGMALFSMSLGMGVPLLIVGTSAGVLLPKVGPWMNAVKGFFGVILLGVAIYLLERIVPGWVSMLLWAALFIIAAIYMGALDSLQPGVPGWRRLAKGSGLVVLTYGLMLMVGAGSGSNDIFRPLTGLSSGAATEKHLTFQRVKGPEALQAALKVANAEGRVVLLDYYADWCVSCKEMEKYTFTDPQVQAALTGVTLLQTDVTANDGRDKALLEQFNLFGPPAILFFSPDGTEHPEFRVVGYMNAETFAVHVADAVKKARG